jgi:uncharacterized protein YbcV (DUF1398 family)
MNSELFQEVIKGAFDNTLSFPEVVGRLLKAGVASYHVDMIRAENRYYFESDETFVSTVPFQHAKAAESFSAEKVAGAVKAIQQGKINYMEFVDQIMAAGTVYYIAYLTGKQVIYFGRKGEFHIEKFPGAH